MARLTSKLLLDALRKRIEAVGGHVMILAKGQTEAGAILLILYQRGVYHGALERGLGPDGQPGWLACGPADPAELGDYLARRRRYDPDLWVVELDHSAARDFAAELL
jgi:hypothetical protein